MPICGHLMNGSVSIKTFVIADDGPAVLVGSRATSSVPFYADILVVVPSVISFVVVVVLLSLVYIIFTRKPRHPNDIYGAHSL